MPSEVDQIKRMFDNFQIPLSMEWLESCIDWCKNDLPPNYTLQHLQNMVYEQWLVLDLREVEITCLPLGMSSKKKHSLTGIYYLQLMQIIDISKPKLWQLQRIRNNVAKNTDIEKDFGKRVLQLTLTDGVQEVEAMEFKPIECLSINLLPGTKFKITGPVVIRNGRLMLEPNNIKNLGGSVDDIIISKAAENVLARALGLPENPAPHAFDEKMLEVPDVQTESELNKNLNQHRPAPQNPPLNGSMNRPRNPNPLPNHNRNRQQQSAIHQEFEIDDELLRELEEDFEESSVTHFKNNISVKGNSRSCGSPDLFEEHEMDDDLLNQHLDQLDAREKQIKVNGLQNVVSNSSKDPKNEVIILDDSFDNIDIDSHLDHIDDEMANLPCSTQVVRDFKERLKSPELKLKSRPSKKLAQSKLNFASKGSPSCSTTNVHVGDNQDPFDIHIHSSKKPQDRVPLDLFNESLKKTGCVSLGVNSSNNKNMQELPRVNIMKIEKLKNLIPDIGKGKFKLKAKFKCVQDKLSTVDGKYYLTISVTDASGELIVQVHPRIVEKFAESSAERLEHLRKLSLNSETSVKDELFRVLRNIHSKLVALDNVIEVQVTKGEKHPVVVSVVDM
ncbi:recQ-mediated genome instability protein 1-like [Euwallacea fornicatus]|uniref:recQ-mediated genome instability protein 1-like n=1 Tax=Euwallacea fornicatus TaxID=995702 RepID=UPI00338EC6AC